MRKHIVVVELTDDEVKNLQTQTHCGSATDIEKKIYHSIYEMDANDREEPVRAWL